MPLTRIFLAAVSILGLVVFVVFALQGEVFDQARSILQLDRASHLIIYILLFTVSMAISPLLALPLVPLSIGVIDPWQLFLIALFGRTLGGAVIFILIRYFGKPFIKHFVSDESFKKVHAFIPEKISFKWLVLMRTLMPFDILVHVVSLFTTITVWQYLAASFIGSIPDAYVFVYGSQAIILRQYEFLITNIAPPILFLALLYWLYRKRHASKMAS